MKTGEALTVLSKKQAEGEVAVHIANIKVYHSISAGIGEHPDIEAVIEVLINRLFKIESI